MKLYQITMENGPTFDLDIIKEKWGNGKKITFQGRKYRVGRMSYGQYFLEPGLKRGEREPFNEGTIWLLKVENNPYKLTIVD